MKTGKGSTLPLIAIATLGILGCLLIAIGAAVAERKHPEPRGVLYEVWQHAECDGVLVTVKVPTVYAVEDLCQELSK